jgi:hypothetical protein
VVSGEGHEAAAPLGLAEAFPLVIVLASPNMETREVEIVEDFFEVTGSSDRPSR